MSRKNTKGTSKSGVTVTNTNGFRTYHPKTQSDFNELNHELNSRGYIAIDALMNGDVRDISLAVADAAKDGSKSMSDSFNGGGFCNGPLATVAFSFDSRTNSVVQAHDKDGNKLGDGYVKWGISDNIPSVIPPLAMSLPYTAAPLTYIADLTSGLGPRLMYRLRKPITMTGKPIDLVEYRDAGFFLQQQVDELEAEEEKNNPDNGDDATLHLITPTGSEPDEPTEPTQSKKKESRLLQQLRQDLQDWENSYNGYDIPDNPDMPNPATDTHVPGAKQFLEENNMDMHMSECMQDNVMLNMYFPTIGLQRGRSRRWDQPTFPRIIRVDFLPAHSTRLGVMNEYRHINNVYYSDSLRTKGAFGVSVTTQDPNADNSFKMYPAAMPQHLLSDIRYIIQSNSKGRIKDRPTWIVCPTYYPSLNKPYYPQPAWWSVFTSKAFDFSATILYDKYKQRENNTTWGRIIYISLDYLDQIFADEGYQGNKEKQQEFINDLDNSVEKFLQQRENNGKMMRQFMWTGQDGKEHHNVEIVDVKETTNDAVKAGKEELELSTSPIFLALQVDPRLVGVPMVAASNGGTALREMHLLKQQQLSPHQRNYCNFLNAVATYNQWSHAEWHIVQQTLTTLDASKTGTTETISGEADSNNS